MQYVLCRIEHQFQPLYNTAAWKLLPLQLILFLQMCHVRAVYCSRKQTGISLTFNSFQVNYKRRTHCCPALQTLQRCATVVPSEWPPSWVMTSVSWCKLMREVVHRCSGGLPCPEPVEKPSTKSDATAFVFLGTQCMNITIISSSPLTPHHNNSWWFHYPKSVFL